MSRTRRRTVEESASGRRGKEERESGTLTGFIIFPVAWENYDEKQPHSLAIPIDLDADYGAEYDQALEIAERKMNELGEDSKIQDFWDKEEWRKKKERKGRDDDRGRKNYGRRH